MVRSTTVFAIKDGISRSPTSYRHVQQSSILKRCQTQILNIKLDNELSDRVAQIRNKNFHMSCSLKRFEKISSKIDT